MGKIISFSNQKGGSGKTTLSANGFNFAYQFLTGMKYNVTGPHNFTGGYKYFSSSDVGDFDGSKFHNFEFGYRLDL